jgi:hypothetical protein
MHRWDLETDTFQAGQFVKARAYVVDISPDGKYVAYRADHYDARIQCYLAVAHGGYFTALAFFPTSIIGYWDIRFEEGKLFVATDPDFRQRRPPGKLYDSERITQGCPFEIVFRAPPNGTPQAEAVDDEPRNRTVAVDGDLLVATDKSTNLRSFVGAFPREPFQATEPADWVKAW